MYFLYFGNDTDKVRQAAHDKLAELEGAGATATVIDGDRYTPGVIADAVGAVSLFGGEQCFLLDTPSSDKVFEEEVTNALSAMAESSHSFVIIEGPLLAAAKKTYGKYAASAEEFKAASAERYNIFALADSLSKKDKRTLWVQLIEARSAGLAAEEIIGTLWWQLKSLRLASLTRSAGEADMKDFPYNKAKRALSNFKAGELELLSASLLKVYHDGHGGIADIDLGLERWVLTL